MKENMIDFKSIKYENTNKSLPQSPGLVKVEIHANIGGSQSSLSASIQGEEGEAGFLTS